jgi:hypothetical protein
MRRSIGFMGAPAVLLCLYVLLCQSYAYANAHTELTIHRVADSQARVADCYPYYNTTHNANCTLRSAWATLAHLSQLDPHPITLRLPAAALLSMDAALGGLELESTTT